MTEENLYQVYDAGEESKLKEDLKINLLEDLLPKEAKKHKHPIRFSQKLARILAIVGVAILVIYFAPGIINFIRYRLSGSEVEKLTEATQNAKGRILPSFDPSLSKTNRIYIPSIGVDTDIEEATYDNYESALKKGVWRVSNFGEPDRKGAPIILAAHRYGYLAWTNNFRHLSSFYNLPKVKVGDMVNIVWEQRKYSYGVYKTENGTAISDYSADLILYTCESLSGEERIFVYAKIL